MAEPLFFFFPRLSLISPLLNFRPADWLFCLDDDDDFVSTNEPAGRPPARRTGPWSKTRRAAEVQETKNNGHPSLYLHVVNEQEIYSVLINMQVVV